LLKVFVLIIPEMRWKYEWGIFLSCATQAPKYRRFSVALV